MILYNNQKRNRKAKGSDISRTFPFALEIMRFVNNNIRKSHLQTRDDYRTSQTMESFRCLNILIKIIILTYDALQFST